MVSSKLNPLVKPPRIAATINIKGFRNSMKDKTLIGGIVVMVVGVVLIGVVWLLFLRPTVTPTAPLQAIPVTIDGNASNFTTFEITSAESEVTFQLNETLRGLPTTVVGGSREIAGQIAINFDDVPESLVGPILINARTLATENTFRNNAIHNFILDTEVHELITFRPTEINGLPASVISGEPVTFQIKGELTIRDVSQVVTFNTTVTLNGRTELLGFASAQITRSDFALQIPSAPGVANVSEDVVLTISFTAFPLE